MHFGSLLMFPGASVPWNFPIQLNLAPSRDDGTRFKEEKVGKWGWKWGTWVAKQVDFHHANE